MPSTTFSLRVRDEAKLAAIDERAAKAGLSRNQYIIQSALGELDDPSTTEDRLNDIEERLSILERYQGLSQ